MPMNIHSSTIDTMKKLINRLIAQLFSPPNYIFYEICYWCISLLLIIQAIHYQSSFMVVIGFISGSIAWVTAEYSIHRFIFHFKTKNIHLRKMVYAVHGVHHANPKDKNKFYVPLVPSLVISIAIYYVLGWFLGNSIYSFLSGLLVMHLAYNRMHLLIHSEKSLNNRYLIKMREHHLLHHKNNGHRFFGVMTEVFDKLFKTN